MDRTGPQKETPPFRFEGEVSKTDLPDGPNGGGRSHKVSYDGMRR